MLSGAVTTRKRSTSLGYIAVLTFSEISIINEMETWIGDARGPCLESDFSDFESALVVFLWVGGWRLFSTLDSTGASRRRYWTGLISPAPAELTGVESHVQLHSLPSF